MQLVLQECLVFQHLAKVLSNPIRFGSTLKAQFGNTTVGSGIQSLIGTSDVSREKAISKTLREQGSEITEDNIKKYIAQSGSGFKGMSTTGKLFDSFRYLTFFRFRRR